MSNKSCAPSRAEVFSKISTEYKEKASQIANNGGVVPALSWGEEFEIRWLMEEGIARWQESVDEVCRSIQQQGVLICNWPVREIKVTDDETKC